MRVRRFACRAVVLLAAGAFHSVSHAQDFAPSAAWMSGYSASTIQNQMTGFNARMLQTAPRQGRSKPGSTVRGEGPQGLSASGPLTSPSTIDESLAYTPNSVLVRQTVVGFVDRLRSKNPVAAKSIAEQFGRNDYNSMYRGIVRPFGLRDDNAADALTAYTVLGWMIATGAADPGRQAVASARQQIGTKMAADATLRTPANRAKVGEELKLLFVTLHAGWQSARREGKLREYSDGVAAMFMQQGADLRALRLTSTGLVAA